MDFEAVALSLAESIRGLGPIGPVVLFVLFVIQCVIPPIPSEPMMMAAGFVYGPRVGGFIAWLGVVVGAVACFGLSRAYGRPLVERFVRTDRLQDVDRYLEGRGGITAFFVLLGIRLVAFTSFDVVSYGFGLVKFPLPSFLLATAIGVIPKVAAFTYLGATAATRPAWLGWVILAGTFGLLFLLPWLWRRRPD